MKEEIWKDIKGYERYYQVSNLGNIKNLKTKKTLKGFPNKKGYLSVKLYKLNANKTFFIHRLVAITFLENTFNKPQVNHINGVKTDNNVCNLEWCTNSENMNHRYTNGNTKKYSLYFDKIRNKWESYINHKGKKIHLGRFTDKEEALLAFEKKYIEINNFKPW